MTAVGWIGAFFLLAVIIRAKIKPIGNMLVPACLIGGVIGCVIINTVGLPWTTTADYSLISGQMYNFMFINLGITVAAKAEEKKRDNAASASGNSSAKWETASSPASSAWDLTGRWPMLSRR